jgi:hypothetical protein
MSNDHNVLRALKHYRDHPDLDDKEGWLKPITIALKAGFENEDVETIIIPILEASKERGLVEAKPMRGEDANARDTMWKITDFGYSKA